MLPSQARTKLRTSFPLQTCRNGTTRTRPANYLKPAKNPDEAASQDAAHRHHRCPLHHEHEEREALEVPGGPMLLEASAHASEISAGGGANATGPLPHDLRRGGCEAVGGGPCDTRRGRPPRSNARGHWPLTGGGGGRC